MRYQHTGRPLRQQLRLQRLLPLDIQVVCRLVQQVKIWPHQPQNQHRQPRTLPARQAVDPAILPVQPEARPRQHRAHLRIAGMQARYQIKRRRCRAQLRQILVRMAQNHRRCRFDQPLRPAHRAQHRPHQLRLARTICAQNDHPVAALHPFLSGLEQQTPVRGRNHGIGKRHQRLRMGARIYQPDRARRAFLMGRPRRRLDLVGAVFQLLGFGDQQITAGIDADILQLRGLAAQLIGVFLIQLEPFAIRRVRLHQRHPRRAERQGKHPRHLRSQKQRPLGHAVQKRPVMAGRNHRHITRQARQPALQFANARQVQMVGRLVQQIDIRCQYRHPRQQGRPLPAAA